MTLTATLTVLSPVAPSDTSSTDEEALPSIAGRRVTLLGNGWPSWDHLRAAVADRLRAEHDPAEVSTRDVPLGSQAPAPLLDEIAADSDAVVLGLANCGSCAVATTQNAGQLARRGVPYVAVVTEQFVELASSLDPALTTVVLPAALEQLGSDQLDAIATDLPDRLVAALVAGRR
ncbi:MAG: hypothetical protein GEV07_29110 [Streptosporangiales bacterium]|nr:hypothetical protein [Streptosporangiales bacterium]